VNRWITLRNVEELPDSIEHNWRSLKEDVGNRGQRQIIFPMFNTSVLGQSEKCARGHAISALCQLADGLSQIIKTTDWRSTFLLWMDRSHASGLSPQQ
jgi:hypothetical protein